MEVPGFEADAKALAGRRKADQAIAFTEALKRARTAVESSRWDEALAVLQTAQMVPGYEQEPATAVLQTQARNGAAFEQARTSATNLLETRQFERAAEAFDKTATLAQQPSSPISRDALSLALNGKTFASLLQDADQNLRAERWSEAKTVLKSASALPGFSTHAAAQTMTALAKNGAAFAYYIEEGQRNLASRAWNEALTAFEAARKRMDIRSNL